MAAKGSPFYLRLVTDDFEPVAPLSIEDLETGLRLLGQGGIDHNSFWDKNIEAFRQTVLLAIRDTSDALLSPAIPMRWQIQLERELESLVEYVELADRYIARRSLNGERSAPRSPSARSRIH
jgi:hypothetical protein